MTVLQMHYTRHDFLALVGEIAQDIGQRPIDTQLQAWLNTHYGADSPSYQTLRDAVASGVAQGWLCARENGGVRWGRVSEATAELAGFSVDVVQMQDLAGPHHTHPLGEVDLIFPIDESARFDGHPAGWCVYGPGSSHQPTVSGGAAWVLYLLPQGQIEFTRRAK